MANIGHFTTEGKTTESSFDPVPPGDYNLQITNSDVKPTKDGKGKYIWLEETILDGPYAGRKVFDQLNLWNANPTASKIAEVAFTRLCKACGKVQIQDTAELHGIPFVATVGVDANPGYNPKNTVKKYHCEESGVRSGPTTAQVAATAATATKAPWEMNR